MRQHAMVVGGGEGTCAGDPTAAHATSWKPFSIRRPQSPQCTIKHHTIASLRAAGFRQTGCPGVQNGRCSFSTSHEKKKATGEEQKTGGHLPLGHPRNCRTQSGPRQRSRLQKCVCRKGHGCFSPLRRAKCPQGPCVWGGQRPVRHLEHKLGDQSYTTYFMTTLPRRTTAPQKRKKKHAARGNRRERVRCLCAAGPAAASRWRPRC